jgi:hypothetical protein
MKQSPSWEPNSSSATQEILYILQNPQVHYHAYMRPPLAPILGQLNSVQALKSYNFYDTFYLSN